MAKQPRITKDRRDQIGTILSKSFVILKRVGIDQTKIATKATRPEINQNITKHNVNAASRGELGPDSFVKLKLILNTVLEFFDEKGIGHDPICQELMAAAEELPRVGTSLEIDSPEALWNEVGRHNVTGNPGEAYMLINKYWPRFRLQPASPDRLEEHYRKDAEIRKVLRDLAARDGQRAEVVKALADKITEVDCETLWGSKANEAWLHKMERISNHMVSSQAAMAWYEWHEPYNDGWMYVEDALDQMLSSATDPRDHQRLARDSRLKHRRAREDFFRRSHHCFFTDSKPVRDSDGSSYLYRTRFQLKDSQEERYTIPVRMAKVVAPAIARLLRGEQSYYESDMARAEVACTHLNEVVKISTCTFLQTMATHYVTGKTMYDENGDKFFDGRSHIVQDTYFSLIHTQTCANSIMSTSLGITADHKLVVFLQDSNHMEERATWRTGLTTNVLREDFEKVADESGAGLYADAIEESALRVIQYRYPTLAASVQVEVTGFALDVLRGKRPCFFSVARFACKAEDLAAVINGNDHERGAVVRFYDLVSDRPILTLRELLRNAVLKESEVLRAAIFFYLRSLSLDRSKGP